MSGIWAVVPVKPFAAAKQRLSGSLNPCHRAGLARAMLADVLGCLRDTDLFAGILLVTSDPEAAALAQDYGADVCKDQRDCGTNAAVLQGLAYVADRKAVAVAILPSDLPFLEPADVSGAIAALDSSECVIAPAWGDKGTNLLALRPPRVMQPSFGPCSFERHLASARSAGIRPALIRTKGFGLDIDTEFDFAQAARCLPPGRSCDFIAALRTGLTGIA